MMDIVIARNIVAKQSQIFYMNVKNEKMP